MSLNSGDPIFFGAVEKEHFVWIKLAMYVVA